MQRACNEPRLLGTNLDIWKVDFWHEASEGASRQHRVGICRVQHCLPRVTRGKRSAPASTTITGSATVSESAEPQKQSLRPCEHTLVKHVCQERCCSNYVLSRATAFLWPVSSLRRGARRKTAPNASAGRGVVYPHILALSYPSSVLFQALRTRATF